MIARLRRWFTGVTGIPFTPDPEPEDWLREQERKELNRRLKVARARLKRLEYEADVTGRTSKRGADTPEPPEDH